MGCLDKTKALASTVALLFIGIGCCAFILIGGAAFIFIIIGALGVLCVKDPPAKE